MEHETNLNVLVYLEADKCAIYFEGQAEKNEVPSEWI